MITSFFKKKDAVAVEPTEQGDLPTAPATKAEPAKRPEPAPSEVEGGTGMLKGRKRLRKGVVDDDDEQDVRSITPTPAPQLGSPPTGSTGEVRPMIESSSQKVPKKADAMSEDEKEAVRKDAKECVKEVGKESAKENDKEDVQEGDEMDDDDDDDDDEANEKEQLASSSGKMLSLKPAAKAPAGKKVMGATAAAVQYHKYSPKEAAIWKEGEAVPYLFIARVFSKIEAQSKRLLITEMMANAFRTIIAVSPEDLLPAVCLAANKLAPDFMGVELGIGDSIMIKAVAETCGRSVESIKASVEEEGDLGTVCNASRAKQMTFCKPKPLTARGMVKTLTEIAQLSGGSSQLKKKDKVKAMLVAAREMEAQYIVRSLQGKMRIGLAESTVLVALAHAAVLSEADKAGKKLRGDALQEELAEGERIIKQVYCEMPNYEVIVPALLEHGLHHLHEHASLTAGIPVKPMLAKPTKGISEVLDRFSSGRFTCEYKYDGERAQIHMLEGGKFKIFSRNSEDNTSKYPDIAAMLPKAIAPGVTSFILDAEAVAVNSTTGAIQPFQVLSTRKRKDADVDSIVVRVCVFSFDLLFLNGESLLQRPLAERRELLHKSFLELPNEFQFAKASDAADVEAIQEFLNESIVGNCEGLMVKTLDVDATYEPSKRSLNWLKVKKDYLQGMTDSCDLVPIGAYFGKGKRTGVYGAYLLACYNEEEEEYQSVCKIGTGFSDTALAELHASLSARVTSHAPSYYRTSDSLAPDVWFEPCQVWEVMAADLSISPVHLAAIGLVDAAKGIALRFPRFLRVRDDKSVEDATSSAQIAEMYNNQATTKAVPADDEDDF